MCSHLKSVHEQGPGNDKVILQQQKHKNIWKENHVSPFHAYCGKVQFQNKFSIKPGCPPPTAWQRVFLNSPPSQLVPMSPVSAF